MVSLNHSVEMSPTSTSTTLCSLETIPSARKCPAPARRRPGGVANLRRRKRGESRTQKVKEKEEKAMASVMAR